MSPKKSLSNDFENRFFDLLEGTIQGIDKKVDKISNDLQQNTADNRKMSTQLERLKTQSSDQATRLAKLERVVFPDQPQNIKDLPPWYRDPSLIKLLTLVIGAVVLVISLFAALKGVNLPGVFGFSYV